MPDHSSRRSFSIPAPRSGLRTLCLAILLSLPILAQNGTHDGVFRQPIGQAVGDSFDRSAEIRDPLVDDRQLRYLNAERQKALVSDTNKLLKLAKELDSDIGRETPDTLNPDQIHKIAEIEKLARSVKDKMSTSVRGTPAYQPPLPPFR